MSEDSLDVSDKTRNNRDGNVFDQFHDHPVCDIPATGKRQISAMKRYRPKRKDMTRIKDYDLTQTYTIMDRDPVKIRVRDTTCETTPHPPGFSAAAKLDQPCLHGPIDKFLMEQYREIIECYQTIAHELLAYNRAKRIREEKEVQEKVARALERFMGPDWFQELSNPQRTAVDQLAQAIIADLNRGTIDNTKYILAKLGLVLRPNSMHVRKALQQCASCPVEFLLVLYQITNPNRTSYSINDRLLLSAVMHLTIKSTLRELHVRIPSPPRPRPKKPVLKKVSKKPCSSPYLEDLLLPDKVPQPKFHSPNKFYPFNSYFTYVYQMRCEQIRLRATPEGDTLRDFQYEKTFAAGVCTCTNCCTPDCAADKDIDEFTRIEIDLITEWVKAQKYYHKLVRSHYIPALFKATVYSHPIGPFRPNKVKKTMTAPHNSLAVVTSIDNEPPAGEFGPCACDTKTKLKPTTALDVQLPSKLKSTGTLGTTSGVSFATDEPECICSRSSSEHMVCEEGEGEGEGWLVPESSIQEAPPSLCAPPCTVRDYEVGPLLEVKTVDSGTCACREAILKRIDECQCHCPRCEDDRRRANSYIKYVVENMKEMGDGEDDACIPIVKDLKVTPICTCMEKYKKRWERFEEIRGARKVQEALKSLDEKFVIQGTAVGPDGNIVYIINSVQPPRCCQCARIKQMEEEEKEILKNMPMLPGGCIKYHIQGVQARPEGNIYIVGGTTENTECDCMELYERFTQEHTLCLKLYDAYMKKIAYDMEEYMKEVDPKYCDFSASATWSENEVEVFEKSCTCHVDRTTQMCCCACTCMDNDPADDIDCVCSVKSCPCGMDYCECVTEEGTLTDDGSLYAGEGECPCTPESVSLQDEAGDTTNCACSSFEDKDKTLTTGTSVSKTSTSKIETSRNSVKKEPSEIPPDPDVNVLEDAFMDKVRESYKKHALYKDLEDPPVLQRYMIFKKLPTNPRQQRNVLKTALKKLAEDGFPLARLPGVENLPIFASWWRFRLRQYYTDDERFHLLHMVDQIALQHFDCLKVKMPDFKLDFLRQTPWMQNFDHQSHIKEYDVKLRTNFYRKIKEMSIKYARNVFTLMRTYNFPDKTFRDVFFSYMASKEEDILIDQIWKISEVKRVSTKRRCF